jgi:translation elongation factor EF-Tu-like GTPase
MISDNEVRKKTIFTISNISGIVYRDVGIHVQAENQTRYLPSSKQQGFSVNMYEYTYLHASSSWVQRPQDMEYIFNMLSAVIS